ncbi:hypothetical protein HNR46_002996 [Haloferula luteola]|uniref:Uncharacterized protein n=1 Tax=Haloferula luteola TaxID=595692 RepID=A0A840VDP0_9BACT|nr:hypothetical protein [Haloferula luteola]MBB5352748.1 hypothetical protein [Haloferula luteola]
MKLPLHFTLTTALLGTISTAMAHPGHDHSHMSTFEFAWHHWLTGGSIVGLLGFGAFLLHRRAKSKDRHRD